MKNSTRIVGQKIREVRLGRRMTQEALCGTEMTRNHLSLIERGKALPSLGTLCYLADRLDVPVGYFFSTDERDEARFASLFAIDDIKRAYTGRSFDVCCRLCEAVPQKLRSDEISMLLAISHMEEAKRAASDFLLSDAEAHLRGAADAARRTAYFGTDIIRAAEYYELLNSSLFRKDVPEPLADVHSVSSFVNAELVLFLKMLRSGEYDVGALMRREHRVYIDALSCADRGEFGEAYERLESLPKPSELPYYMRYRVLDTVEVCAGRTNKYEDAYSAAKMKLELLERSGVGK